MVQLIYKLSIYFSNIYLVPHVRWRAVPEKEGSCYVDLVRNVLKGLGMCKVLGLIISGHSVMHCN